MFGKKKKAETENSQQTVTREDVLERRRELQEEKEALGGVPQNLSYVSLRHVDKVYENGIQAVYDFNIDIEKHEFIVFVGPSGCGKSTTLRMIAGLEDITNGDLYIDGEYSNDRSPKDRDIAMVFQSYALYPHMTVYNNMAFGLKIRHLPKAEIDQRVHDAAKILQIEEYLDRKPKALSGGQRQRVALGRAIVRNAKVFLMDEPLSNLDAKLRVQMRSEIIKLTQAIGATTIYVTHDQTEAMTMASRIVVMKLGRVQQIGSPIEIYNHPANIFVAGFIGSPAMNFMKGTYEKGEITLTGGAKIKLSKEEVKGHDEFYKAQVATYEEEVAKLHSKYDPTPEVQEQINALNSEIFELAKAEEGDEEAKKHLAEKQKELRGLMSKTALTPEIEKRISEAEEKLSASKAALEGSHQVIYGLRPEDIHEGDEEHVKKYGGTPFDITVSVAELLGHEYYVHTDFAGTDMIAKIPLVHEIKIGDKMKILFDQKKHHVFDAISTNRIF